MQIKGHTHDHTQYIAFVLKNLRCVWKSFKLFDNTEKNDKKQLIHEESII